MEVLICLGTSRTMSMADFPSHVFSNPGRSHVLESWTADAGLILISFGQTSLPNMRRTCGFGGLEAVLLSRSCKILSSSRSLDDDLVRFSLGSLHENLGQFLVRRSCRDPGESL